MSRLFSDVQKLTRRQVIVFLILIGREAIIVFLALCHRDSPFLENEASDNVCFVFVCVWKGVVERMTKG